MMRCILLLLCVGTVTVAAEDVKQIPLPPTSWDFGSVGIDFSIFHRFPLANTTNKRVRILGVDNDCDCTTVLSADSVVNPGDTAWFNVEFQTRNFFGPSSKSFFVKTDVAGRERIEMFYSGLVGQWMWGIKPSPVGVFMIQGQMSKRVQISNMTNDRTSIEAMHVHDSTFTIDVVERTADKGGQMIVDVKANPSLKPGTYLSSATLALKATGAEKEVLLTLPVKIVRF